MNAITQELQTGEAMAETEGLKPNLRDRILAEVPTEVAPSIAHDMLLDGAADIPSRKVPFRFAALEWGAGITVCVLVMLFSVTFMGRRVSNTFNQATSSIADGPADSYSYPGSGSGSISSHLAPITESAAPSAGQAGSSMPDNEAFIKSRNLVEPKPDHYASRLQERNGKSVDSSDEVPSYLRKVDKKANIAVEVPEVEQSGATVESMVVGWGGFVSSNTLVTGSNGLRVARLALRVPVGKFESALSQIAQLGDVKAKNVTGEDITERYSDADQEQKVLSSELNTKDARLQAVLKREAAALKNMNERQRATYLSKITWQQRAEVRELRIQTAQSRARLDLLRRISTLSSLEVELQEKPAAPGQGGLLQEMGGTGRDAFASFLLAVRIPLNLLIWILAYAPLWLPLLLIYRYFIHRSGQQTS